MRASISALAFASALAAGPAAAAPVTFVYKGNVMTCDPAVYVECYPDITLRLSGYFKVDEHILGMSLRDAVVEFEVWTGDILPPLNADAIVGYDFGYQGITGPAFRDTSGWSTISLVTDASRNLVSACLASYEGPPDWHFGCGVDSVYLDSTYWTAPSGRWTTVQPVPTPASLPLLAAAVGLGAVMARRRAG